MTPAERLRAARALLTPPGAWTRGALARDREGNRVECDSVRAVCWCAGGAISRATDRRDNETEWRLLTKVVGFPVSFWNDAPGRTQADVLAALDAAIELAKAESN